ncbi:outer membrane protein assembly factor BamD [Acetobacter sp. AN02]|nr:outer membrane protein assembly factor BamD [Acetobacter sp. AN02]MDG6094723.1 outer membrane protein assembly factor BamD [Acetobacter sp. AN02]
MPGLLLLTACGGNSSEDEMKKLESSSRLPSAEVLYNNGIDALRTRRYALAAAQFEVLQQNYPYSGYTANSQLMEGYAYYLQNKYPEAAQQLNRFIELHPTSPDSAYAFYLLALCYYEQIADVGRDQQLTMEAMSKLQDVVVRFPQTTYARDAQLKIDLCRDHLAGKEMLVGRFYEEQHNYESAINRFQHVVQDFQTTNHVAEALERLVEVYLKLGLTDQARRTAAVLAYNYPGSKWYRYAYNDLKEYKLLSDKTPLPGKLVNAAPAAQSSSPVGAQLSPQASRTTDRAPAPPVMSRAPVAAVSSGSLPSPEQAVAAKASAGGAGTKSRH